jgi:stage II sporulation protein M
MDFAMMFHHFRTMKGPLAVSVILFAAGIWIGAQFDAFDRLLNGQLESLRDTAEALGMLEYNQWWFGLFIFLNNTVKSIAVMYLGLLFGIVPAVFLLLNGMVIGHLLTSLDRQGVQVIELIVKGLLPHGILEIPAILLACGYGLKMGTTAWSALTGRSEARSELKRLMLISLPLMLFLTLALGIAAVIEATVTVRLLSL